MTDESDAPATLADFAARHMTIDRSLIGARLCVGADEMIPCPACGAALTIDIALARRPAAETERKTGVRLEPDAFGMVECAIPWVVCAACDYTADGSEVAP